VNQTPALGKRLRLLYNVNTGTKGFDRERRIWIASRGAITLAKQVAKKVTGEPQFALAA
jgi:hypothetical protein